jgi:hypothetical protein
MAGKGLEEGIGKGDWHVLPPREHQRHSEGLANFSEGLHMVFCEQRNPWVHDGEPRVWIAIGRLRGRKRAVSPSIDELGTQFAEVLATRKWAEAKHG